MMNLSHSHSRTGIRSLWMLFTCIPLLVVSMAHGAESTNPLLREFSLTVNPTALNPPTWWHVPTITPSIWSKDPVNMDAYQTTETKALTLKPGKYQFGTFTFDFFFTVTLSGTLEFSKTLDQCVGGRGSKVLTIHCSHTQPYPQDPDY